MELINYLQRFPNILKLLHRFSQVENNKNFYQI